MRLEQAPSPVPAPTIRAPRGCDGGPTGRIRDRGRGAPWQRPRSADCSASPSCPTFSFELFPPRTRPRTPRLSAHARAARRRPARSSSRSPTARAARLAVVSLDVLRHLLEQHRRRADGAPDLRRLVVRRGVPADPRVPRRGRHELPRAARRPAGGRRRGRRCTSATSAAPAELVQLIHRVQAERVPFTQDRCPGFPGARGSVSGERVHDRGRRVPERAPAIAVAAAGPRHAAREGGGRREPRDHAALLRGRRLPGLRRTRARSGGDGCASFPGSCRC